MSSHDLAGCMLSLGRATSLNARARWICILHANAMAHGWYGSNNKARRRRHCLVRGWSSLHACTCSACVRVPSGIGSLRNFLWVHAHALVVVGCNASAWLGRSRYVEAPYSVCSGHTCTAASACKRPFSLCFPVGRRCHTLYKHHLVFKYTAKVMASHWVSRRDVTWECSDSSNKTNYRSRQESAR